MATAEQTKFCGITLPVSLWGAVRVAAIKAGKTMPEFVAEALRAALQNGKRKP
jgi:hypothetical protein